jgi:hypothetical protein
MVLLPDLEHAFLAGFKGSTSQLHLHIAWLRQSPRYLKYLWIQNTLLILSALVICCAHSMNTKADVIQVLFGQKKSNFEERKIQLFSGLFN